MNTEFINKWQSQLKKGTLSFIVLLVLQEKELYGYELIEKIKTLTEIEIAEGKFHQVKRMCAAVGLKVVQLHRRSIGSVVLDDGLEPGQFRPLTDEEREALRSQSR